jgi:hypothetical protein
MLASPGTCPIRVGKSKNTLVFFSGQRYPSDGHKILPALFITERRARVRVCPEAAREKEAEQKNENLSPLISSLALDVLTFHAHKIKLLQKKTTWEQAKGQARGVKFFREEEKLKGKHPKIRLKLFIGNLHDLTQRIQNFI